MTIGLVIFTAGMLIMQPCFACMESPASKEARFAAVDANKDGSISYQEYYNHEKGRMEAARNSSPSAFKNFIDEHVYGLKTPKVAYDYDKAFNDKWATIDKNKRWSKEEFLNATMSKSNCGG